MMEDKEQYFIRFKSWEEFERALDLNHLADDVCHSERYFVYNNEFSRDRFLGFIIANEMTKFTNGLED